MSRHVLLAFDELDDLLIDEMVAQMVSSSGNQNLTRGEQILCPASDGAAVVHQTASTEQYQCGYPDPTQIVIGQIAGPDRCRPEGRHPGRQDPDLLRCSPARPQ